MFSPQFTTLRLTINGNWYENQKCEKRRVVRELLGQRKQGTGRKLKGRQKNGRHTWWYWDGKNWIGGIVEKKASPK